MNQSNKETEVIEEHDELDFFYPFYGTDKELFSRYTHCSLCGGYLHFTHITNFSKNLTQEIAKCPECGTNGHRLIHRLQ